MKKLLCTLSILLVSSTVLLAGCTGNKEWRKVKDTVLPQLMEGNLKRRLPLIVHREISRDLDIGYVLDHEIGYDFIFRKNLEEWGISENTLHKTAMRNLEKIAKDTEIQLADAEEQETGRYAIIETGDGYDAARILLPAIQKKVRKYLGEEYIAATPTRDFLIFWHKDFSLGGQFMEEVEKQYKLGGKYKLTPRVFLVTKKGIEPLTKQPLEPKT